MTGPLFDVEGRLAGVVVAKLNYKYMLRYKGILPENVNFAVKIGYLRNMLAELEGGVDVLNREHSITAGKPEEVVAQLRPAVGLVLVRVKE